MHTPPAGIIEIESARIATLDVTGAGREIGTEIVVHVGMTVVMTGTASIGESATNTTTVDVGAETDATMPFLGTKAAAQHRHPPRRKNRHQI